MNVSVEFGVCGNHCAQPGVDDQLMLNPSAAAGSPDTDGLQQIIDCPSETHSEAILQSLIGSLGSSNVVVRSKASNALALFLLHQPKPCPILSPILASSLDSTNLSDVCAGLRALTLILQLSPALGLELVSSNRVFSRLEDATALASLPKRASSSSSMTDSDLALAISDFLALATNHKSVRECLINEWPQALKYLACISLSKSTTVSFPARHAASLALVKLHLGAEDRGASEKSGASEDLPALGRLVRLLLEGLLSHPDLPPSTPVEGLALVSQKIFVRRLLMSRIEAVLPALHRAISPGPQTQGQNGKQDSRVDTSVAYGVATILSNLTAYKALKSAEDEATDRLRKLASQGQTARPKIEELDEEEQATIEDKEVFHWIMGMLVKSNELMEIVAELVKSESKEVRRIIGRVLLNFIERQECRGKVLQAGGARMLLKIIASLTISSAELTPSPISSASTKKHSEGELDPKDLPTLQALAKLMITTNPLLVFGPTPESPFLLSVIKILTTLLTHPSASLLQVFEALMGLTNIASLSGGLASQVASSPRVLSKIEECMMGVQTGENELIRRAATELLCNLTSTQPVLETFEPGQKTSGAHSRLHLLIALSSSEDLPTALAAAGALALLADNSSTVAKSLVRERKLSETLGRVALDIIEEGKIGVQHRLVSLLACVLQEEENWDQKPQELGEALGSLKDRLGEEDETSKEVRRLIEIVVTRLAKFEDL